MVKKFGCIFLSLAFIFAVVFSSEASSDKHSKSKHGKDVHWSYEGKTGPEHWGMLEPAYSLCSAGKSQSPIDIANATDAQLQEISLSYLESTLKVINNGHTIQVNYTPGSTAKIDGKVYKLLQFHFHTPSEHMVNGSHYDMEMHLVHKNDKNELAVIGVFMKKGQENAIIKRIWNNIPKEINKEKVSLTETINIQSIIPSDMSYYHYYGSLTTPPCSEGVNWSVLKSPIEVSEQQIETFKSLMKHNARPTLPVNYRFVLE